MSETLGTLVLKVDFLVVEGGRSIFPPYHNVPMFRETKSLVQKKIKDISREEARKIVGNFRHMNPEAHVDAVWTVTEVLADWRLE